jgi:hypothetical protein
MRSLRSILAPGICFAIAAFACLAPAPAARAALADVTSISATAHGDDSSAPLSPGPAQAADNEAADSAPDNLGSEQEAPEALVAFGDGALDAPRPSHVRSASSSADVAVTRAIAPAVQPPRS